jgi:hypothetical protein
MEDEKVYQPTVIEDVPFPNENEVISSKTSSGGTSEVYTPNTIPEQSLPTPRVAVELIGRSMNTKARKIMGEFQFTEHGAIQVGKYENGVSGDIKISPAGIVARNTSGIETIAIDGETGDAVFAGTIQTGSIISGSVVVGNNNVIIDGENRQIVVNDGQYDRILIGYQLNGF